MKKSLISLSLITLSLFSLASCGEENNNEPKDDTKIIDKDENQDKDNNSIYDDEDIVLYGPTMVEDEPGHTYEVGPSSNSDFVARTFALALRKMVGSEKKYHALGLDANIKGDVNLELEDLSIGSNFDFSFNAKTDTGTKLYKTTLDYSDGEFAKATDDLEEDAFDELVENVKAEILANIDASFTATAISTEQKPTIIANALNGGNLKLDTAIYNTLETKTDTGKVYLEANGNATRGIYSLIIPYISGYLNASKSEEGKKIMNLSAAYEMEIPPLGFIDDLMPKITTIIAYYQVKNNSLYDTAMHFCSDEIVKDSLLSITDHLFDEDFFQSDEYNIINDYVKNTNMKITSATDGNIEFEFDVDGKVLNNISSDLKNRYDFKNVSSDILSFVNNQYDEEKTYLKGSFNMNYTRGLLDNVLIDIEDISLISGLIKIPNLVSASGTLSVSLGLSVDKQVEFTKKPNEELEYEEGLSLITKLMKEFQNKE